MGWEGWVLNGLLPKFFQDFGWSNPLLGWLFKSLIPWGGLGERRKGAQKGWGPILGGEVLTGEDFNGRLVPVNSLG